jgi:hypothetical protein
MAGTDESTGPVAFSARFPPEDRFAATAAEIAGRLAAACGCAADAADEIRTAVSRAFGEALALEAAGASGIDVTLRADDGGFEADVACGGRALLHCSRTRAS